MSAEVEELRRRFAALRDKELLRIVTVGRAQYRQVALNLAEEELMRRGVAFTTPAANFTPRASGHFAYAAPARPGRGAAFWVGLLLIGGACHWAAGMVDETWRVGPGEHPEMEELYELVRLALVALISLVGGLLMTIWESVD